MKKISLFLLLFAYFTTCFAQQFQFQMNFVDAIGNRDSITLGYDPNATDTLDVAFGETNINSVPYKKGLDVRMGNGYRLGRYNRDVGAIKFQTKKQIVRNSYCNPQPLNYQLPLIEFNIVSTHFPIKAYWNKRLFSDTCRDGSVFTAIRPGGWWDVGGGFRAVLNQQDFTEIKANSTNFIEFTDTINVYWAAFGNLNLLKVATNEVMILANSVKKIPNPTADVITFTPNDTFGEISRIEIYTNFGQMIHSVKQTNQINLESLPSGIYLAKITNQKGMVSIATIQKIE